MRPSKDEMDTEFWLKARTYWAQKADKYAKWGLMDDFQRAMNRMERAAHEFSRAAQISQCGCLPGGCNYQG